MRIVKLPTAAIHRLAALSSLTALACAHAAPMALPARFDDQRLARLLAKTGGRPVIGIVPIEPSPRVSLAVDIKPAEMLTTQLAKSGRFDVVERGKMDKVMDEQRLAASGLVDDASKAAQIGMLVGAEAIIVGSVTSASQQETDKFAYREKETLVRIDARAIDTTSGKILFTESAEGRSVAKIIQTADGTIVSGAIDTQAEYAKAATDATSKLAAKLGGLFPAMGFVVSVDADRVLADIGSESGVAMGTKLLVVHIGEKLTSPSTNEFIGYRKTPLDTVVVDTVDMRTSGGPLQHVNGVAPVARGDVVVVTSGD